jgi:hypothetical protein
LFDPAASCDSIKLLGTRTPDWNSAVDTRLFSATYALNSAGTTTSEICVGMMGIPRNQDFGLIQGLPTGSPSPSTEGMLPVAGVPTGTYGTVTQIELGCKYSHR